MHMWSKEESVAYRALMVGEGRRLKEFASMDVGMQREDTAHQRDKWDNAVIYVEKFRYGKPR